MWDSVNFFTKILRPIFGALDKLIYELIAWILTGIFELSNLMASAEFAQTIYKNMYLILAIFMVFKLTFSFIQYMVSPDKLLDKEKGVGKIITNTIIMLILLIVLPIFFFQTFDFNGEKTILNAVQEGVLNTLPNLILGTNTQPDDEVIENSGKVVAGELISAMYTNIDNETQRITNLDDFYDTLLTPSTNSTKQFKYRYMFPITTVAGIALVFVLLGMAVDIAVRAFKLIILQVIAPIPVMSYIDPKSSKDGAFSSWVKNFITTYADLFIKLGTIYVLLLLIQRLFASGSDNIFGESLKGGGKGFVKVFLIIGLFKFAKDAPKFIKDALGIKDNGGGGGLFGGLSTLGAVAGTVGGAAAGLIGGAAGGVAAGRAAGHTGIGSGLLGAAGGLFRGGSQGFTGAKKGNLIKGMSGAVSAQNAVTQRKIAAAATGSTFMGRMGARADRFFGTGREQDVAIEDAKNLNAAFAKAKNIRDTAKDKGFINRSMAVGRFSYKDSAGRYHWANFAAGDHSAFKDAYEYASSHRQSHVSFNGRNIDMVTAGNMYKNLGDAVSDRFLSTYNMGDNASIDADYEEYLKSMDQISDAAKAGINLATSAGSIDDAHTKDLQRRGAQVAHSVNPEAARRRKADRDAIENKSGK